MAEMSARECEMEANRLRGRLAATVDQLQTNLRPARLKEEVARGVGLDDISAAKVFDVAVKRHPIPTAVVAVGLSACAFMLVRNRSKSGGTRITGALRDAAASLSQSAGDVFRERAAKQRREFVGAAKSHIETGLTGLADTIEKKVEDVIEIVPEASGIRPLVSSAVKLLLSAIAEGMLTRAKA